jgi:hypothetical protein
MEMLWGKTQILGVPDRPMVMHNIVLSLWGILFWSSHWLVVVLRWSGVSPPALMAVGLGGMVPRKLDEGCVLCCMRREEETSGAMVASMASLVRGFTSV